MNVVMEFLVKNRFDVCDKRDVLKDNGLESLNSLKMVWLLQISVCIFVMVTSKLLNLYMFILAKPTIHHELVRSLLL